MIYQSIRTGRIIPATSPRLARLETNRDIKEIMVPGDHSHGDIFKLITRARFKVVANGKLWAQRFQQIDKQPAAKAA